MSSRADDSDSTVAPLTVSVTQLPDTDDPHALLGVEPDATSDEVRRAYLRKIKVFKPDLDPAAFQRIRAAYETLTERIALLESLTKTDSSERLGWDLDAEPPTQVSRRPAERDKPINTRLKILVDAVDIALAGQRRDEAARILLTPEAELLASDPDFTRPLLDVCCATVLSAVALHDTLAERYHDVLTEAGSPKSKHSEHPLWDLVSVGNEHESWTQQVREAAELTTFLELGSVAHGPARREAGRGLAERFAADPSSILSTLERATPLAPTMVELVAERATAWADAMPTPATNADASVPTAVALVRQLNASLSRAGTVRSEWFKRLIVTLAGPTIVIALGGSIFVMLAAFLLGLLVYQLGFDATRSLYLGVVRPTVVPWLAASGQPIELVAEQLRRSVGDHGMSTRLLRPDDPSRYPDLLLEDRALSAFASLARLTRLGE